MSYFKTSITSIPALEPTHLLFSGYREQIGLDLERHLHSVRMPSWRSHRQLYLQFFTVLRASYLV